MCSCHRKDFESLEDEETFDSHSPLSRVLCANVHVRFFFFVLRCGLRIRYIPLNHWRIWTTLYPHPYPTKNISNSCTCHYNKQFGIWYLLVLCWSDIFYIASVLLAYCLCFIWWYLLIIYHVWINPLNLMQHILSCR